MATASYYGVGTPEFSIEYTTIPELLNQLSDNSDNSIDAQDVRDSVYTLWQNLGGTSSVIPLSNTVWVNQDLSTDDEDNRIFKSYEDAVIWINSESPPAVDNQWQVMLPGGLIPLVTVYEYIKPSGGEGTIIEELRSAVVIPLNPIDAIIESYISNVQVQSLNVTIGNTLTLANCVVLNIIDSASNIISINTNFLGGTLADTNFLVAINSSIVVNGEYSIESAISTIISNAGSLTDINLTEKVQYISFGDGGYNINIIEDVTIQNSRFKDSIPVIIGSGKVLNTENCVGDFTVSGPGTWINKGGTLDARNFTGNLLDLDVTDTQALAEKVDELNLGGTIPSSNTVWINYDLLVNDETNRIFGSQSAAVDWVNANGSPSASNLWQIILPGGIITEDTILYSYVRIHGHDATVLSKLKSDVTYSSVADFFNAYISNVQILLLELDPVTPSTGGICAYIYNSIVHNIITPTVTAYLAITDTSIFGGDFTNVEFPSLGCSNTQFLGTTTNINSVCKFCTSSGDVLTGDLQFFHGSMALNTGITGQVFYTTLLNSTPLTLGGNLELANCTTVSSFTITVPNGVTLTTINLGDRITVTTTGTGVWNNFASGYDNSTSGLTATDTQAAIDELSLGSYKVYTALISQAGTNAPSATILENTLGVIPVWNYDAVGSYYTNLTSTYFPSNKGFTIIGDSQNLGNDENTKISSVFGSIGGVYGAYITTFVGGALSNDVLKLTSVEIRVYY